MSEVESGAHNWTREGVTRGIGVLQLHVMSGLHVRTKTCRLRLFSSICIWYLKVCISCPLRLVVSFIYDPTVELSEGVSKLIHTRLKRFVEL